MSNFDWLLAGASNTWFAYPYKYRGDKEDRKWTWTNHLVKIPFRLNRIFYSPMNAQKSMSHESLMAFRRQSNDDPL